MTAPLLEVRVRTKRYGARVVLDAAHVAIAPGEIVSLLGPSGCGKSTLLRIAAGLDRDFEGSVSLRGEPLDGPSSGIGVIFQEPRLLPWLRVAQNVAFPSRARGEAARRASELLAEVGLPGTESRWPKELSGGMAQRVAIARGLFTRPGVLLLDEPFSAVDAITRMRLQDLLLSITQAHRMAALVVTHDIDEALLLSDRVLVMMADAGRGSGALVREFRVDAPRPRARHGADGLAGAASLRAALLDSLAEPATR